MQGGADILMKVQGCSRFCLPGLPLDTCLHLCTEGDAPRPTCGFHWIRVHAATSHEVALRIWCMSKVSFAVEEVEVENGACKCHRLPLKSLRRVKSSNHMSLSIFDLVQMLDSR